MTIIISYLLPFHLILVWYATISNAFITPVRYYNQARATLNHHYVMSPSSIPIEQIIDISTTPYTTQTLAFLNGLNDNILAMDQSAAEQLAGPCEWCGILRVSIRCTYDMYVSFLTNQFTTLHTIQSLELRYSLTWVSYSS